MSKLTATTVLVTVLLAMAASGWAQATAPAPVPPVKLSPPVVPVPPAAAPGAVSKIESVVVYRGQALVTRVVTLPDAAGEHEIVVSDLPEQVVGQTLSASAENAGGATIRSVRFRSRTIPIEPGKDIADLDAQIKKVNAQIFANTQRTNLANDTGKHLEKLESFAAPTASVEMSKGVLNPDTLAKVSDLISTKRQALTEERIKLQENATDLTEELAKLTKRRGELAAGAAKVFREAIIYVSKAAKGPGSIALSYLAGSADWTPTYNVRLGEDGKKVQIEYLALVQQSSGEEWANVKLTLSTATPAMNAECPLLAPLWVGLVAQPQVKGGGPPVDYVQERGQMTASQFGNVGGWSRATTAEEQERYNWAMNTVAAQAQRLELNVEKDLILAGTKLARSAEEGLAVSYPLPGRMNIASRADRQLIQLAALELESAPYYEAAPLLSNYVYRKADLTNTSTWSLLPGPYSAYDGSEFVGRGNLPLVARGQSFTVGLGVDSQLRCQRELTDKSDKVSWGSRIQTFDYVLRLENYKGAAVVIRLYDRIPASKTDDIQVKLTKVSEALSSDPLYLRDLKDKGVLRWDIDLVGGAAKDKRRELSYGFEMKFAKDAHVGKEAAALMNSIQADFKARAAEAVH